MDAINLILTTVCVNYTCTNESSINYIIKENCTNDTSPDNEINYLKKSLSGQHLFVATLENFPLSYTSMKNGTLHGEGVSFNLLKLIATKLNFTFEVVLPNNNIIGSDSDITGSLLDLMRTNKTDLAAAFIPFLREPEKYIEYSSVILDEGEWIIVMRRPEESASGSGLLAPFDYRVWILILISFLAVGPIIYVLIIIRNKLTGDDQQKPYSIGHCAWFVYGALMKQGSTLSPIADSTRLLFATWWIFITILTSFYTANLTAFLTLSKFTLPFNTVEDILKKEKSFVALRGGGIEYAIKNADEPLANLGKIVSKQMALFEDKLNDTVILTKYVGQKDFIFIRDKPAIDHALYLDYSNRRLTDLKNQKEHCRFAKSKKAILRMNRLFVYPKGSKFKHIFDSELQNLVESVKHLLENNLPNAEICPQDLKGTERQLRNGDLTMTYYIMLTGFATASVVFVTEISFRFLNGIHERKEPANVILNKIHKPIIIRSSFVQNATPPPPYGSIFKTSTSVLMNVSRIRKKINKPEGVRKFINGRDYMVYKGPNGENKLIPVRAPSATLFQYTYTQ